MRHWISLPGGSLLLTCVKRLKTLSALVLRVRFRRLSMRTIGGCSSPLLSSCFVGSQLHWTGHFSLRFVASIAFLQLEIKRPKWCTSLRCNPPTLRRLLQNVSFMVWCVCMGFHAVSSLTGTCVLCPVFGVPFAHLWICAGVCPAGFTLRPMARPSLQIKRWSKFCGQLLMASLSGLMHSIVREWP